MDKVSIITTFYNCERFLKYALTSVIQQKTNKLFNIEYILVNDCSTDNGLKVAEDFIKTYKNIKNINIKLYTPEYNLGCGAARKYGIEKATGDYFMFLDADDYYLNNDFVLRAYKTIGDEGEIFSSEFLNLGIRNLTYNIDAKLVVLQPYTEERIIYS